MAHARGIEFGNIYFDEPWDEDSLAWLALAEQRYELYENWYQGPQNDDIVFQSWQIYPDYVLPETRADAYTHGINRYFREAPVLNLGEFDGNAPLPWLVEGRLVASSGEPIGQVPVYLSESSGLEGMGKRVGSGHLVT